MPPCDCSNCLPEEAEALWLGQKGLTVDNFDKAVQWTEPELNQMLDDLPLPPPNSQVSSRPELLRCGAEDDIRSFSPLKSLVTKWRGAFEGSFYNSYPKDSEVGPWDYFSDALAWDLAMNIDTIENPSDLGIFLPGEIIGGQFRTLFASFVEWQEGFEGAADAIAQAVQRRKNIRRKGPAKVPVSVEGTELVKKRDAAEKLAMKEAKLADKELADAQKAALANAKRLRIKGEAKERKRLAEKRTMAREERLKNQATRAPKGSGTRKRAGPSPNESSSSKRVNCNTTATSSLPQEIRPLWQTRWSPLGAHGPPAFGRGSHLHSEGNWPWRRRLSYWRWTGI
ncbi:uncharacterized protein MELLADRAFT_109789 [Melampsora larici-populina 98AG31]|uniref:Uncharacterized protein n=1 Tax=Melampsora larici-populina (strain 98AG31 / pathotype 3-4-7) TaxID=747676 RepID=F4RXM9_MELLP|nr:uncharacterized protein MELLADRAFT_109789 [Melampsora larici-populina 98AG31]EGG02866.1 hypothetical protein MELLADRAFT_109789 [Melampsora larici-populina 98AG31]